MPSTPDYQLGRAEARLEALEQRSGRIEHSVSQIADDLSDIKAILAQRGGATSGLERVAKLIFLALGAVAAFVTGRHT